MVTLQPVAWQPQKGSRFSELTADDLPLRGKVWKATGWSAPQASDRPPPPAADVTVFRPSSFFILVQTGPWLQLQVQLVPLMQVFLRLDPAYRGQMCGEAAGGGLEADGQPGRGRSLGGGDPGLGQWLGG